MKHKNFFNVLGKGLIRYRSIVFILVVTTVCFALRDNIPLEWKIVGYTISNFLKSVLMFLLPFFLFPFIVQSLIEMRSQNILFIAFLTISVFFSNIFAIVIAYGLGRHFLPSVPTHSAIQTKNFFQPVDPLFSIHLYTISVVKMLVLGVFVGMVVSRFRNGALLKFFHTYYCHARMILEKFFSFFLPIYVLGSVLKFSHEANLFSLLPAFLNSMILLLFFQIVYVILLFFIANGGHFKRSLVAIKNTLPAFMVGLSTMSSLITMPVTLKAAEKNTDDPALARFTITATVNFHDIGDCISLPWIALTIIYLSSGVFPSFEAYIVFAFLVGAAQFSAIAVPCGSIVIMLPFLTKYLGFTQEMEALMIALSMCIEPIGTAMNVMGNSALVIIMNRSLKIFKKQNISFLQDDGRRDRVYLKGEA